MQKNKVFFIEKSTSNGSSTLFINETDIWFFKDKVLADNIVFVLNKLVPDSKYYVKEKIK